ncbi:hypothetical protein [Stutzerimonas chloritidismutans]
MRKLTLFLLFLGFSPLTFAVDYFWYFGSLSTATHYSTPLEACNAQATRNGSYSYGKTVGSINYSGTSANQACRGYTASGSWTLLSPVYRSGDGCSGEYDTVTGQCKLPEPNLCEAAAGAKTSYYVKTQLDSQPPAIIDVNGCEATFGGIILCKNLTDGTATCSGTATITGKKTEVASGPVAGEGVECSGADCEKEAPQPIYETIPCDYTIDENGYKVCTSAATYHKPGTTKCGEVNGTWTCVESPKSVSTDKKTDTKVEEIANPDGSTTVKQTDKTTVTTCEGIKNCTTKDSTTTKEGGTNPDGSPKGDSEKCTGDNCGVPDDLKEDVPGDEEGEGTDPVIGGLDKPGEPGNFDDANAQWDQKLEDAKLELSEKIGELGSLFQPIAEINLASGSGTIGCGETFTVLGQSMAFCPGKYEKQLEVLAQVILFICALIALFIIFKPETN